MNSINASIQNRIIIFRAIPLVMVLLFWGLQLSAQPPGLSIGNVGVCNNSTVLVPLIGNNLTDIGAITLFITYDSLSLSYLSYEEPDPQLTNGLMVNAISNPSRISIVWSKTSGATFTNSTLLKLKFSVLKQSGNLNFIRNNCELANISIPPQIIQVNYSDGSIYPSNPSISSEPEDKTIFSQSNVVFQVSSPTATAFNWQESRTNGASWTTLTESNTYTGTETNSLTISRVPVNYNHFFYRCILNMNSCPTVSAEALLSVDSLTGTPGQPFLEILHLRNNPNPFTGKVTLEYSVPLNGLVTIKIFSMTGEIMDVPVEKFHVAGSYRLEDNFVYLPAGIYFCKYVLESQAGAYETHQKMIKLNQN